MQLELVKTTVYDAINPEGLKHPFVITTDETIIYVWSDDYVDDFGGWLGYSIEDKILEANYSCCLELGQIQKECFLLVDQTKEEFTRAFNNLGSWLNAWENRTVETEFTPEESDIFDKLKIVFPHIVSPFNAKMTDAYFCELCQAYQDLKKEPVKKKPKKKGKKK